MERGERMVRGLRRLGEWQGYRTVVGRGGEATGCGE
jgi:hypothetical protein